MQQLGERMDLQPMCARNRMWLPWAPISGDGATRLRRRLPSTHPRTRVVPTRVRWKTHNTPSWPRNVLNFDRDMWERARTQRFAGREGKAQKQHSVQASVYPTWWMAEYTLLALVNDLLKLTSDSEQIHCNFCSINIVMANDRPHVSKKDLSKNNCSSLGGNWNVCR